MTETFCKLTHEIMRATHWISRTTGKLFKLSGTQKIIWVHMSSRYEFFRSLGKEWFDDQNDIARDTGCDVSTVKAFIRLLVDHGYIVVQRKKLRGYVHSNSYNIVAPLELHNKYAANTASVRPLESDEAMGAASVSLSSSVPAIAAHDVPRKLEPMFEDIPLEAYIDKPAKPAVIVHETLRGFADTLDEEIAYAVPVLPKGLPVSLNDPDLWG
ncbi:helix-turn-helix domain-containing protein [Pseudomonas sp. Pdm06]|uniref:helix-turn-helix domain-containing protein n=1 Tax=Pseudomonas sp. Pdm06 TaxID=1790044 RepID=UPI00177DBCC4|nr:helix-turn-helix domain-containing protein [Pseudomonas sp. Pdm06]MBD9461632.1 helix-turn-helix domain-containing protein [Pseudomonas sp. Pdm06]